MKTETCSPAQHKIKYDVLDVKCLSFSIELQHIGMSSIKDFRLLHIRTSSISNNAFPDMTLVKLNVPRDLGTGGLLIR